MAKPILDDQIVLTLAEGGIRDIVENQWSETDLKPGIQTSMQRIEGALSGLRAVMEISARNAAHTMDASRNSTVTYEPLTENIAAGLQDAIDQLLWFATDEVDHVKSSFLRMAEARAAGAST